MNENHDENGRFAATTMLGAHDKMDKLAANAHAKAEAVKPPTFGTAKVGRNHIVTQDGEYFSKAKSARDAELTAQKVRSNYAEAHNDYHAGRAQRVERASAYLQKRNEAYSKQGKFNF